MRAGHRGWLCLAAGIGAWALPSAPAQARGDGEIVVELIHSSLPLYTFEWRDLWPRSVSDGESFGCSTRVGYGDWRFTPADEEGGEQGAWYRFSNYGVFHCAVNLQSAEERDELEAARWERGFFVRLGTARHESTEWELWAIQTRMRPGSDYTLLAREANRGGLIVEFRVLQQRCPRGNIREVEGLDIWSTRYCAIDSRQELLSLARRMLRLPPAGRIARVAEAE